MEKKAMFFIDDVIWVLRDITRQKPKSILQVLTALHIPFILRVQSATLSTPQASHFPKALL